MTIRLPRRAFLRGSFGATLSLPLLDVMLDERHAHAQATAKRFFIAFAGVSLGSDGDRQHNDYVPDAVGPNYDPTKKIVTTPLAKDGLQKEITIVSGLRVPTSGPGSYYVGKFHGGNHSPLLSGVTCTGDDAGRAVIKGVTSDQLAAEVLGTETRFPSGLQYIVQAKAYSPGPSFGHSISMRRRNGGLERLEPGASPQAAWRSLFYGFQKPADAAAQKMFELERKRRLSILDACQESRVALGKQLGAADQRILDRFYDHCNELEKRVLAASAAPVTTCSPPLDPGADPAEGANTGSSMTGGKVPAGTGWSNETLRGKVFAELIHLAFACDLTRVAAVTITRNQCFMAAKQITGDTSDLHGLGHFGSGSPHTTAVVSRGVAWHMEQFGYLVKLMRDTKDATGASLLDSSAMAFVTEGGHGPDPVDPKQTAGSSHSMENMVVSIAGGAGGLKRGQHIAAPGRHPASVLLTLLNAVGVNQTKLGDVSGAIAELRA